jgi:hypothetical protein
MIVTRKLFLNVFIVLVIVLKFQHCIEHNFKDTNP